MISTYKEAMKLDRKGDTYYAAKKFLEAELYFLNQIGHLNQL